MPLLEGATPYLIIIIFPLKKKSQNTPRTTTLRCNSFHNGKIAIS
jgi:hypothetical protein